MTREEAIAILKNEKECVNRANKNDYCNRDCYNCELVKTDAEILTALDMAIEELEQKLKTEQFAKWVATEIFDDWEYNKDAFAEIACRKLAKLGIVREKGNEWELVEAEESEDKE